MLKFQAMDVDDVGKINTLEMKATPFSWSVQMVQDSLQSGACCQTIVQAANQGKDQAQEKLAGYFIIQKAADEAELLNLVIFKKHQRQGLACSVLHQIFETLLIENTRRLFLEVRESNIAAQTLYLKAGFKQIAIRKDYYRSKGKVENACLMRKKLQCRFREDTA